MATLYITEFSDALMANGMIQIPVMPYVTTQTVTYSSSNSISSVGFSTQTRIVRVETDTICSFTISSNPTAGTSCPRMTADQTEYFGVRFGDKVAAITNV